jgi:hypothetical protein
MRHCPPSKGLFIFEWMEIAMRSLMKGRLCQFPVMNMEWGSQSIVVSWFASYWRAECREIWIRPVHLASELPVDYSSRDNHPTIHLEQMALIRTSSRLLVSETYSQVFTSKHVFCLLDLRVLRPIGIRKVKNRKCQERDISSIDDKHETRKERSHQPHRNEITRQTWKQPSSYSILLIRTSQWYWKTSTGNLTILLHGPQEDSEGNLPGAFRLFCQYIRDNLSTSFPYSIVNSPYRNWKLSDSGSLNSELWAASAAPQAFRSGTMSSEVRNLKAMVISGLLSSPLELEMTGQVACGARLAKNWPYSSFQRM